ncbi:ImmA/IrrE family metallo-endopeptidase [Jeotgalibacillus proteolyticus]|uniref:ImmA/IrrE family metallo-endopeptidase n=1 Tax=Jeotgalibacillus proteolyticus TaxID=2082395 RepID=UPI001430ABA0|nr:ImmA/IrrE family metallo-endopeptidase [Jeotgalibacillus proteolyticus]
MKLWKTDLENYIENLYLSIDVFKPSQIDPETVAARLGIALRYEALPSKCLMIDGVCYIFLDERLSDHEQKRYFCHELCHALLHVGSQRNMPLSFRQLQEWRATNFMQQACVPTFMLEKVIQGIRFESHAVNAIAKAFSVEHDLASKRLQQYLRMKKEQEFFYQMQQLLTNQKY